jgi:hypothetical protein
VRELVFALTRARALVLAQGLVLVPVLVQMSMWALALVQALLQALVLVLSQASVPVLVLVLVLSQASVQALSLASVQVLALASVQVLAPASLQASAYSCSPPCRLLWRQSSDPVLRPVALQGQGARIAAVVPRLR